VIVGPGRFESSSGTSIKCRNGFLGPAVVALRPERLTLGPAAAALDNRFTGTVQLVSYLGASVDVHVRVPSGDRVIVSLPNRADGALPKEGDTIDVGWTSDAAVVLADDTNAVKHREEA
jgi:putative spermidine/putrescine transport system ATP-binding protein